MSDSISAEEMEEISQGFQKVGELRSVYVQILQSVD